MECEMCNCFLLVRGAHKDYLKIGLTNQDLYQYPTKSNLINSDILCSSFWTELGGLRRNLSCN